MVKSGATKSDLLQITFKKRREHRRMKENHIVKLERWRSGKCKNRREQKNKEEKKEGTGDRENETEKYENKKKKRER